MRYSQEFERSLDVKQIQDSLLIKPRASKMARAHVGPFIDEGGQAWVYQGGEDLPGIALKIFKEPKPPTEIEKLTALIQILREFRPQEHFAEWIVLNRLNVPLRPVVMEDGWLIGIYHPLIPARCFVPEWSFEEGSLKQTTGTVLYQAQMLAEQESVVGFASENRRWKMLLSLVETVYCMHEMNLIHGDLSMANVLADGEDEVYLIDASDCLIEFDNTPIRGIHRESGPLWDPYISKHGLSKRTDVFVLAWWIVCLFQGRITKAYEGCASELRHDTAARFESLSPGLPDLLRRALGITPQRPSLRSLYPAVLTAARRVGAVK